MIGKETSWVKARANCNSENIFKELSKILKDDVNKFNRLTESQRGKRSFLTVNQDNCLHVFRACIGKNVAGEDILIKHQDYQDDSDQRVDFMLEQESFISRRGNLWEVKISFKWNPESLDCDYFVDEEMVTDKWISQKILGDFMFESLPVT
ncbi:MAG: hypothetical protein OXC41_01040 [Gammaproteobacteria bacterium]|nr:hypothetical protein [Gammaproteobacteria bacterium]